MHAVQGRSPQRDLTGGVSHLTDALPFREAWAAAGVYKLALPLLAVKRRFGLPACSIRFRVMVTWQIVMRQIARRAPMLAALLLSMAAAQGQVSLLPAEAGVAISGESGCADRSVTASAVETRQDIRAFVQCAYEYFNEVGMGEARRAFREDERWRSGPTYVFVFTLDGRRLIFPPDPTLENTVISPLPDRFGNNIFDDGIRIARDYGRGWWHYERTNPTTGVREPKASYLMSVDAAGVAAVIGAGIYRHDFPAACAPEYVNAELLDADPSPEFLQEFVRCAAYQLETRGYFATADFMKNGRWSAGSIYLFGLDEAGRQVFTGHGRSVNGVSLREWAPVGSARDPFDGRDVVAVGYAFGETFLYYTALNPATGRLEKKVGFVRRVNAVGVPILLGAGYYLE